MTDYILTLYCPYDLSEFSIHTEAPTEEAARKQTIGRTVTCLQAHDFDVEDYNIISIYPYKPFPVPPYKLMPEEKVKEAKWLKGAIVSEPLPLGAQRKPETTIEPLPPIIDGLTTFLWEQRVSSPEYPDQEWKVLYRRDVFKKFHEQAKRLAQRNLSEAIKYLVEHAPGLSAKQLADILNIGYFPTYRAIRQLLGPTQIRRMKKEVAEQSPLLKFIPTQTEELIKEPEIKRLPQIRIGPAWLGQATYYPLRWKTERELEKDLQSIFTLEGYLPKPEEWSEMQEQIKKQREAWLRQHITTYLSE